MPRWISYTRARARAAGVRSAQDPAISVGSVPRGWKLIHPPFCQLCGDPVDGRVDQGYDCSACRRKRPAFVLARSAVRYRGPAIRMVHGFKYAAMTCLAGDLSEYLRACVAAHWHDHPIDAVTYVPLHATRERERGYNQAALLAKHLAAALDGLPLLRGALVRVRPTSTQTNLSARKRRENVRNAFRARDPDWLAGRRILLVDDVMTTGATAAECSRVLKEAGAAAVYVVTVARG